MQLWPVAVVAADDVAALHIVVVVPADSLNVVSTVTECLAAPSDCSEGCFLWPSLVPTSAGIWKQCLFFQRNRELTSTSWSWSWPRSSSLSSSSISSDVWTPMKRAAGEAVNIAVQLAREGKISMRGFYSDLLSRASLQEARVGGAAGDAGSSTDALLFGLPSHWETPHPHSWWPQMHSDCKFRLSFLSTHSGQVVIKPSLLLWLWHGLSPSVNCGSAAKSHSIAKWCMYSLAAIKRFISHYLWGNGHWLVKVDWWGPSWPADFWIAIWVALL